ncbi:CapA family protein [Candidatus Falkowbacteria bacterium]|nr:CapA family protein [Candidatus Falkowbacteria bacterium]
MERKYRLYAITAVSLLAASAFLWWPRSSGDEVSRLTHVPAIAKNKIKTVESQPSAVVASTSEIEPAAVADKGFSGLFFGDIMIDRHVATRIKNDDIASLMGGLSGESGKFFKDYDLVSANLEGAVTDKGAHYALQLTNDFAFKPATVASFKQYGFNFFNLANNHLTDQGQKGVTETRTNLSALGFGYSGCADRQIGDCSGAVKELNGTKIALLGFSMVYGDLDSAAAKLKVAEAKKQNDFVLVNVHWGTEYTHQFSKKQQALGHALVDAGADAVIGHHPHVTQGIERYKGKPIFYSLGNFIFDQYFSRDTQESLAIGLFMEPGTTTVRIFPLKQKRSVPELMNGKEKDAFLLKVSDWSTSEQEFKEVIKSGIFTLNE